jgi:hypothetical protein
MKTKNTKTAAKQLAVAGQVETPTLTVEAPIAQARASIAEIVSAGGVFAENTLAADVVEYISTNLDAVTGGMRQSILTLDSANRTSDNLANSIHALLYGRYQKQTVDGLKSAAKNIVPRLREMNCLGYRDPNGLRDLNKILQDNKHKAHIHIIHQVSFYLQLTINFLVILKVSKFFSLDIRLTHTRVFLVVVLGTLKAGENTSRSTPRVQGIISPSKPCALNSCTIVSVVVSTLPECLWNQRTRGQVIASGMPNKALSPSGNLV